MKLGFSDSSTSALVTALKDAGFVPYLTSVGGSGLGILPSNSAGVTSSADWSLFSDKDSAEFGSWVEGRGRWLFV